VKTYDVIPNDFRLYAFFFLTRQAQYITARSLDMVPFKFTGKKRNSKAKVTVVLLY